MPERATSFRWARARTAAVTTAIRIPWSAAATAASCQLTSMCRALPADRRALLWRASAAAEEDPPRRNDRADPAMDDPARKLETDRRGRFALRGFGHWLSGGKQRVDGRTTGSTTSSKVATFLRDDPDAPSSTSSTSTAVDWPGQGAALNVVYRSSRRPMATAFRVRSRGPARTPRAVDHPACFPGATATVVPKAP